MKNVLKVLALALTPLFILAGCSQNNKNSNTTSTGEPYTVEMIFGYMGNQPRDLVKVQDSINEISVKKANVKVHFIPLDYNTIGTQLNLMIAGGQQIDLTVCQPSVAAMVSKNQLLDINSAVNKYGKDIISSLGTTYLNAGKVGDKLYTVATIRDMAYSVGFNIVDKYVQKYNVDMTKIKTFDDVEKVLKTIVSGEPGLAGLGCNTTGTSITDFIMEMDSLGDSLGVLMNKGDSLKVVNLYETPEYKTNAQMIRKWYQEGLVMKDLHTSTQGATIFQGAGKLVAQFCPAKPGYINSVSQKAGQKIDMVPFLSPWATTTYVNQVAEGVTVTCKNVDATVKFLNLMYGNKEIINLFDWGIEGQHYVKTSDGHFDYPSGITKTTAGFMHSMNYEFGNELISNV